MTHTWFGDEETYFVNHELLKRCVNDEHQAAHWIIHSSLEDANKISVGVVDWFSEQSPILKEQSPILILKWCGLYTVKQSTPSVLHWKEPFRGDVSVWSNHEKGNKSFCFHFSCCGVTGYSHRTAGRKKYLTDNRTFFHQRIVSKVCVGTENPECSYVFKAWQILDPDS